MKRIVDSKSDDTISINDQKLEAVQKMHKIIKHHHLMNYMIKWIENGFMHFPEGSVSPIEEKDEMLEYSDIERDHRQFLHPITEESLADIGRLDIYLMVLGTRRGLGSDTMCFLGSREILDVWLFN